MDVWLGGECQCGRIRYQARLRDRDAYYCHCGMCRKATGGVAAAFRAVARADVTWLGPEPDRYRSSAIAERGFCGRCGTPLSFAYLDSDGMDLTIGSFDDPSFFCPVMHACVDSRLDGWADTAALPGERLADNAALVERWQRAGEGR